MSASASTSTSTKERISKIFTVDEDEYDVFNIVSLLQSNENLDDVAEFLYHDLDTFMVDKFFIKSAEWFSNNKEYYMSEDTQDHRNYHLFQRIFGDITFRMNEILRKRIQTDEDLITVSIENMSYTVDLTDMTITHKNKYGQNYILSYIDEIKWMEYLLIPDESIHLRVSSSSSHIIRISRVITPIRSFVLKNY
jgi:hypothetical protein